MNHDEWRQQVEARKARPPRARPRRRGHQPALLPEPEPTGIEVIARLKELRPVAEALVAGALANHAVKEHLADYPRIWTEASQRRSPTVRVEFEHTIVIGGIGESLAAGEGKAWGPVIGVFPLQEDDPVHPCRLLYLFKSSSPYQARYDQRKAMKGRLGKAHARLVMRAMRSTLAGFLPTLTAADVVTISERLGLSPRQFWRAAKGRLEIAVREQRPLFIVVED